MPVINSHNSWSQLEEVWLGDVYPSSWYDHLPSDIRDVFYQITETTKEDLKIIENKLIEFGVKVRRPTYTDIVNHTNVVTGQLHKPQICPRDYFVVIGNYLAVPNFLAYHVSPWIQILSEYKTHSGCHLIENTPYCINGANVVRYGKDIIIDLDVNDSNPVKINQKMFQDYRVTLERNGGHMDGCFAILKPGLLLANHYYDGYDRNFPGWEKIFLDQPSYWQHRKTPPSGSEYNNKFYADGVALNQAFNEHVVRHAQDWVGDYTETYFELNCLVLNESNVMMLGYNEALEKTLSSHGITVHWVPFRCRGFWDGGMHCITLDIRRQSSIVDYFPERG